MEVVTSDGTSELVRRDPVTLEPRAGRPRAVRGTPGALAERSCLGGRAGVGERRGHHVPGRDRPGTGEVDRRGGRARGRRAARATRRCIMNGIAALGQPGEFLLTGKGWRAIRHVRLIPDRDRGHLERLLAGLSREARRGRRRRSDRPQRAVGVAAVGEPGAALEDVPRAEVAAQQPGHARRGEVERQHEQAAAPGVLGGVPRLVPEQAACRRPARSRRVMITLPRVKAGAGGTGSR